jgi:hypothetical protein
MMHLDEEQVQRVLHGELGGAAADVARAHVAACAACRAHIAAAEREENEVHRHLGALDHDGPAPARAARARDAMARAARTARRGAGWQRRAAALLVAVGAAGVAYAVPGSPLPGWVDVVAARIGALGNGVRNAPATTAPPTAPLSPPVVPESTSGIAVAPGSSLLILFTTESGAVEVVLSDGDLVQVQAPGTTASFTADEKILRIESAGTGSRFRIEIPRTAPRVEIRAGARRIFLKEGERITTAPAAARGSYFLELAP